MWYFIIVKEQLKRSVALSILFSKRRSMNYKSKRWKIKREKILRRDGYLCQESKRYGKRVDATTVHHVYPAEDYPEYEWCDWNLISLSNEQHNAMHDRVTNELTEKGKALQKRIIPPLRRKKFNHSETGGVELFPTLKTF